MMSRSRRFMLTFYFPIVLLLIMSSAYSHRYGITLVWVISLVSMLATLRNEHQRDLRDKALAEKRQARVQALRPSQPKVDSDD